MFTRHPNADSTQNFDKWVFCSEEKFSGNIKWGIGNLWMVFKALRLDKIDKGRHPGTVLKDNLISWGYWYEENLVKETEVTKGSRKMQHNILETRKKHIVQKGKNDQILHQILLIGEIIQGARIKYEM